MDILILDTVNKKLSAVLGEAQTTAVSITVSYADASGTTIASLVEANANTLSTGVTPVDICTAPSASVRRIIRNVTFYNADNVTHNVYLSLYDSATRYIILKRTLLPTQTWAFGA